MTNEFDDNGFEEDVFAEESFTDGRPLSQALVIGIGGTGAQVLARLNGAMRSNRSDQHAVGSIELLLFDAAASPTAQSELPRGTGLRPGVREQLYPGISEKNLITNQRATDHYLDAWWDERKILDRLPTDQGLKRSRMLGHLWFYSYRQRIRDAVSAAITAATAIDPSDAVAVTAASRRVIPVFIVCSSAGGTGSSGFLEVVAAVHAAMPSGWIPQIRAFIFLPGVFEPTITHENNGAVLVKQHKANAYGFFKELDHFMLHPERFTEMMNVNGLRLTPGDTLVDQVNLIDRGFGTDGSISLTDAYQMTSEAMYQFLFTKIGLNVVASSGVNVEEELKKTDARGKPRRYCSIGVSRVVFPGHTYRNHLRQWWRHWVLTECFIKQPTLEQVEALRTDKNLSLIVEAANRLIDVVAADPKDLQVEGFRRAGRNMPDTLAQTPETREAQAAWDDLTSKSVVAVDQLRRLLNPRRSALGKELDDEIRSKLFSTGWSIPTAAAVLRYVLARAQSRLDDQTMSLNAYQASKSNAAQVVVSRLRELQNAEAANVFEGLWGKVTGKGKEDRARAVGEAIKDWTEASIETVFAEAKVKFAESACASVREMITQLEDANDKLVRVARRAEEGWRDDTLFGKDAGSHFSTFLVPADMRPVDGRAAEIEDSELARSCHRAIREERADRITENATAEFIKEWCERSDSYGAFDLGGASGSEAMRRAEDGLLDLFDRDAIRYALSTLATKTENGESVVAVVPRLPTSIAEAAKRFGEEEEVRRSVDGLMAQSKNVAWQFDPTRDLMEEGLDGVNVPKAEIVVSTSLAFHAANREFVDVAAKREGIENPKPNFPDPERIVALSTQWAVALHMLPVVESWKYEYDDVVRLTAARAARGDDIPEPCHIDKRFYDLPEPLPRVLDSADALLLTFRGLVLDRAQESADLWAAFSAKFVSDRTRPARPPIFNSMAEEKFFGIEIKSDDGRLTLVGNEFPLGESLAEVVASVAKSEVLPESIEQAWKVMVEVCNATKRIGELAAIVDLLGGDFEQSASDPHASNSEREQYTALLNAYDQTRSKFRGY